MTHGISFQKQWRNLTSSGGLACKARHGFVLMKPCPLGDLERPLWEVFLISPLWSESLNL